MAVRVVVGERRVVDHGDALLAGGDEEERRALGRDGDDDQHGRHVAARDEPLLAADPPAAAGQRLGRRGDRRRVGPGVGLGHRVGVLALAAEDRPQPAVDLRLRAGRPHVVGVRDVPREGVGGAAELLLDERPGEMRPALPAVLRPVQAAGQAGGERRLPDRRHLVRGQPPAGELGGRLARDQLGVDEPPRAPLGGRGHCVRAEAPADARSPPPRLRARRAAPARARRGWRPRRARAPASRRAPRARRPARPTRAARRATRSGGHRTTSRAARARSASSSASGGGDAPLRSTARASGRSRSGSGVSDSQLSSPHGIDSDHIMRLITKSGLNA